MTDTYNNLTHFPMTIDWPTDTNFGGHWAPFDPSFATVTNIYDASLGGNSARLTPGPIQPNEVATRCRHFFPSYGGKTVTCEQKFRLNDDSNHQGGFSFVWFVHECLYVGLYANSGSSSWVVLEKPSNWTVTAGTPPGSLIVGHVYTLKLVYTAPMNPGDTFSIELYLDNSKVATYSHNLILPGPWIMWEGYTGVSSADYGPLQVSCSDTNLQTYGFVDVVDLWWQGQIFASELGTLYSQEAVPGVCGGICPRDLNGTAVFLTSRLPFEFASGTWSFTSLPMPLPSGWQFANLQISCLQTGEGSATVQVVDLSGNLISDDYIAGNSAGFSPYGRQIIDLTSVPNTTIALKATLSVWAATEGGMPPLVNSWYVELKQGVVPDGYVTTYGEVAASATALIADSFVTVSGEQVIGGVVGVNSIVDAYVTAYGEDPTLSISGAVGIPSAFVTFLAENPVLRVSALASILDAFITAYAEDPVAGWSGGAQPTYPTLHGAYALFFGAEEVVLFGDLDAFFLSELVKPVLGDKIKLGMRIRFGVGWLFNDTTADNPTEWGIYVKVDPASTSFASESSSAHTPTYTKDSGYTPPYS